jgi:hypothetical protein
MPNGATVEPKEIFTALGLKPDELNACVSCGTNAEGKWEILTVNRGGLSFEPATKKLIVTIIRVAEGLK